MEDRMQDFIFTLMVGSGIVFALALVVAAFFGIKFANRLDRERVAATGDRLFGAGQSRMVERPELNRALGLHTGAMVVGRHRAGEVYLGDVGHTGGKHGSIGRSVIAMAMKAPPGHDSVPEFMVYRRDAGIVLTLFTREVSIGRTDLDAKFIVRAADHDAEAVLRHPSAIQSLEKLAALDSFRSLLTRIRAGTAGDFVYLDLFRDFRHHSNEHLGLAIEALALFRDAFES